MKIFISAGEASGDALGAALIRSLRERAPELEAFGMGGKCMQLAGFSAVRDSGEIGVVGLIEVLRHLPRLFRLRDELAIIAAAGTPDLAVLIDIPDFNLRLARRLRAFGIPIVFYVGPSVWAWRSGRVKAFRRFIDRMMVLFPFEEEAWRSGGVDVVCVGHPLLDEIPETTVHAKLPHAGLPQPGLPPGRVVALLPGSRRSEISRHLGVLLDAARMLHESGLASEFVLPVAPSIERREIEQVIASSPIRGSIVLVEGEGGDSSARREAIARSSLALVASGTATLETALIGRPQVIFYKTSWLSWWIGRVLVRLPWLGLPNIILGRRVVPELLQGDFTARQLADAATALLRNDAAPMEAQQTGVELRAKLGPGDAGDRAAEAVLEILRSKKIQP